MIYIGLLTDKLKTIESIVNIKLEDEYIPGEYLSVAQDKDYEVIFAKSNFKIENYLLDGLELDSGIDYVFKDGDYKAIKMIMEYDYAR